MRGRQVEGTAPLRQRPVPGGKSGSLLRTTRRRTLLPRIHGWRRQSIRRPRMQCAEVSSLSRPNERRRGAVIFRAGGSEAPDNVGVGLWHINWGGPITAGATTLSAAGLAAAIPVPDQICLVFVRIYAGANPGNGRRFRSGRAGVDSAAAAGAQRAAERAIAPIGAFRVVLRLGIAGEVGRGFGAVILCRLGAADRQEREDRCRHKGEAELVEQAAARCVGRQSSREAFADLIRLEYLPHTGSPQDALVDQAVFCLRLTM